MQFLRVREQYLGHERCVVVALQQHHALDSMRVYLTEQRFEGRWKTGPAVRIERIFGRFEIALQPGHYDTR